MKKDIELSVKLELKHRRFGKKYIVECYEYGLKCISYESYEEAEKNLFSQIEVAIWQDSFTLKYFITKN